MGNITKTIAAAVERFGCKRNAYRAGRQNETEVRHDFIDALRGFRLADGSLVTPGAARALRYTRGARKLLNLSPPSLT